MFTDFISWVAERSHEGAEGALAVVKAQARRRVKVEGLQVVSMDWVTVEVG